MPGEKFNVRLAPEEGGSPEPVTVEVGLEGFNILYPGSGRVLRKYPLHHISRWSSQGNKLILFTKSPADVEDRTVVLSGDETTIRSVLDTLTSSCMQMAELLQSGQKMPGTADAALAASSLKSLLKKAKKPTLLTADQVEFWKSPEKAGWLQSQGEHLRTWRRRWFVLKQGFLFRFSGPEVVPSTRPRGVVDLSTVTDVSDGAAATGRPNSIRLSTPTGRICYLADSETAQVEWMSALEGAVAAIVRAVGGWEDDEPAPAPRRSSAQSDPHRALQESLERSMQSGGKAPRTPGMIDVVNYGDPRALGSGGAATPPGSGPQYITVDYGGIAGASQLPTGRQEPPRRIGSNGYAQASYDAGPSYGQAYAGSGEYYQHPQPQPQAQQQYYVPPQEQQQQQQQQSQQQYPGYHPTLFDAATAPQVSPASATGSSPWQTHHTAEGRPYYYNVVTGITQWEVPS